MKKFLIINPFGIGDVLFTTPVIKAIKNVYPDSHISYWCNERVSAILKGDSNINSIFALSRGDLKKLYNDSWTKGTKKFFGLLAGIKKGRFDTVIDFSLDCRYGLACKVLGIKKRIGFNYKKRGRFLSDKINIDGYKGKHVVEYYLDLLKLIGIKAEDENLYLAVPQDNQAKAQFKLARLGIKQGDLLVGISAGGGASWGKEASYKHWPALKYAQLADKIIYGYKAKVVFLGDDSERAIADIITSAMKNKPIDWVGKTTLDEFAAAISCLDILITNDGGPLHIAVALGKKTLSIFGPVDDKVYGPYPAGQKHVVIKKELSCRPCYNNFRFQGCSREARECINNISVEDVLAKATALL
jgi:lipopolysaccharide heptosyltransferase II